MRHIKFSMHIKHILPEHTLSQNIPERSNLCKMQYSVFKVKLELLHQVKSFKVEENKNSY